MTDDTPLQRWHEVVRSRNPALLNQMLAEDAVFHSPILFRPQQGKDLVALYLTGALHVIANPSFHYIREVVDGNDAVLEFETQIAGAHVDGVGPVTCIRRNDQGLISDFKVMIRPLKAVNVVHQRMAELLEQLS